MPDEDLVRSAKNGDSLAADFLIGKYRNFVRVKAKAYFLIGADREDIIQEGMIGLYKAIRDFRRDKLSSFRAFAELCITRQIITAIKTATRQKHIPLHPSPSRDNALQGVKPKLEITREGETDAGGPPEITMPRAGTPGRASRSGCAWRSRA